MAIISMSSTGEQKEAKASVLKCTMPNCYGNSLDDIMRELKDLLPWELLNFLLNLHRCKNNRSRNNALSNFLTALGFFGSKMLKALNNDALAGRQYDYNSKGGLFDDDYLVKLLEEFNKLHCAGLGVEIDELINKFNPNIPSFHSGAYPDNLSADMKAALNDWLLKNNSGNDWKSGGNGGKDSKPNNSVILSDDGGDGKGGNGGNGNGLHNGLNGGDNGPYGINDGTNGKGGDGSSGIGDGNNGGRGNNSFDGDGNGNGGNGNPGRLNDDDSSHHGGNGDNSNGDGNGNGSNGDDNSKWVNPLVNIPNDALLNLTYEKPYFTCFTPEFNIRQYLGRAGKALLTETKRRNLWDIHHKIMLPIFNHYYGEGAAPTCQIKIYFGLIDMYYARQYASASTFSHHLRGRAVDFTMVGVSESKFLDDIRSGAIKLPFGVCTITNGVHITLPYEFEGMSVEGLVLSSPTNSMNSLKIEVVD